jgi:hypothetical protein
LLNAASLAQREPALDASHASLASKPDEVTALIDVAAAEAIRGL